MARLLRGSVGWGLSQFSCQRKWTVPFDTGNTPLTRKSGRALGWDERSIASRNDATQLPSKCKYHPLRAASRDDPPDRRTACSIDAGFGYGRFDVKSREQIMGDIRHSPFVVELAGFGAEPWDLLVVGGGIVGAGVARDAAMRGLRTGLGRTARLRLRHQQPLLAAASRRTPLPGPGPNRTGARSQRGEVHAPPHRPALGRPAALSVSHLPPHALGSLEALDRRADLRSALRPAEPRPVQHALGRGNARKSCPASTATNLTGGVRYFDGLTNDARLVIDTLRSAARHGAVVRNHTRFLDAERSAGVWTCRRPRRGHRRRVVQVKTRSIVNAAGCWAAAIPHSRVRLRLTKGIHLVVDQERFPVPEAVVMAEGKRILFAIPWGEPRDPRHHRHRLRRIAGGRAGPTRPT